MKQRFTTLLVCSVLALGLGACTLTPELGDACRRNAGGNGGATLEVSVAVVSAFSHAHLAHASG
jgi:hypothetical protein